MMAPSPLGAGVGEFELDRDPASRGDEKNVRVMQPGRGMRLDTARAYSEAGAAWLDCVWSGRPRLGLELGLVWSGVVCSHLTFGQDLFHRPEAPAFRG
jgi:hypothetical protein